MNTSTPIDIESIIAQIDAKHGKSWDIWRTATGESWVIKVGNRNTNLSAPTLTECLQRGLNHTDLSIIPRCPEVMSKDQFAIRKCGNKWELYYKNEFYSGHITTKFAAEYLAAKIEVKTAVDRDKWEVTYGPQIAGKTEGIDFVYGES